MILLVTLIRFCIFVDVLTDPEHEQDEGVVSETEAIPSGPRKVDCPEDDEFLSALDKMVSENIQERMRETVKATNIDISVPIVVRSNKKTYDQLQVSSVSIIYDGKCITLNEYEMVYFHLGESRQGIQYDGFPFNAKKR